MSTPQQHFPVGLTGHWHSEPETNLPLTLNDWLFDPSSLTARLKSHCQSFEVVVLGQEVQPCQPNEATEMIRAGEQVLVREVVLYCDDVPQVFARSLLPIVSLTGEQQQLANLGSQPLGQVLFSHPDLQRTAIEIASFGEHSRVALLSSQLSFPAQHTLWGRRSLFLLNDKPLMVAEVFLPAALAYVDGVTK